MRHSAKCRSAEKRGASLTAFHYAGHSCGSMPLKPHLHVSFQSAILRCVLLSRHLKMHRSAMLDLDVFSMR